MRKSALKLLIIAILCAVAFTLESYAQTSNDSGKNFPFSQNPKKRNKTAQPDTDSNSNPDSTMIISTAANDTTRVAAGGGDSGSRSSAAKIAAVTRTHSASAKNAGKPATDL